MNIVIKIFAVSEISEFRMHALAASSNQAKCKCKLNFLYITFIINYYVTALMCPTWSNIHAIAQF